MLRRLARCRGDVAVWCMSKGRALWLHGPCQAESQQVVGAYTPITKQLWEDRLKQGTQNLANSQPQTELIKKRGKPISVIYPFHEDVELKEQGTANDGIWLQYRNPWNFMRMGRTLEDLDSLAGNVAYEHCTSGNPATRLPVLVTASVDRITLSKPVNLNTAVHMHGKAVWTGKSSLDIRMEISQGPSDAEKNLVAIFTFVARDPITGKSTAINPLEPVTEEEKAIFNERQAVHDARKKLRSSLNIGKGSTVNEELCSKLLARGQTIVDLPALSSSDYILMSTTSLQNTFICQPQQRNIYGRMFGGFLMRRAFELAFSTSYVFGGVRPSFKLVDDITFRNPVNIGDLLRFKSRVKNVQLSESKTSGLVCVEVVASVIQPEQLSSHITNTFDFIFDITSKNKLKEIAPATREEALAMLPFFEKLV